MYKKGVSNILWFVLAFVVILILLAIGILILQGGKEFAFKNLGDLAEEINKLLRGG